VRGSYWLDEDADADTYRETAEALVGARGYAAVLAAGLDGTRALSELSEQDPPPLTTLAPSPEAFRVAEDKGASVLLAQSVGVPAPRTLLPTRTVDYAECREWTFPLVVKARHGQGRFGYAHDYEALLSAISPGGWAHPGKGEGAAALPLVQEVVRGDGHGYFALMRDGQPLAEFMHRRVREVPPSGGPSSVAESFFSHDLRDSGRRILSELRWSGVAMVEFKRDEADNRFKLIEINPKFWGSLGLAVAAGVDFPYLAFRAACGLPVDPPSAYGSVRYQWLSMDIAHSFAVRKPGLWFREVARGTPNDFRLADPIPNLTLIANGALDVLRGRRSVVARGRLTDG
jgi:predicted ATP-grasp superfamily ATP-dependent carboligase